jgi:hypothetical protein
MKLKMISAAVALVAAVASVPAQAGALAAADLVVSGLGLVDAVTLAPFTAANGSITVLSETRTGNATALYNGVSPPGPTSAQSTVIGATVDVAYRCAGDCAGAAALYAGGGGFENNTTTHLAPPPAANFALGDMVLNGSALVDPTQASGLTRANAAAMGPTNTGSANATIQNGAALTAVFTVGATFTGRIVAIADAYVRAFVSPAIPGFTDAATAGITFNITITDEFGATVLAYSPTQMNRGLNVRTGSSNSNQSFAFSGTVLSDAVTFTEGVEYNITINQSSNAIISSIPEPASVALAGLALLGAGLASRRSLKK